MSFFGQNLDDRGMPLKGQELYDNVYKKTFIDRLREGVRAGQIPNKTQEARDWYRRRATSDVTSDGRLIGATSNRIMGGAPIQNTRSTVGPGSMYMYYYDPKWKEKLPIYDIFPCTIVFRMYHDGFLGLNLHYLPHVMRANLMDALYPYVSDEQYDERTRFTFTYPILKMTSGMSGYRQCIKRYLYTHIRSRFLWIHPNEWDIAMMLPVEKFNDQNVRVGQQAAHGAGIRRGSFR